MKISWPVILLLSAIASAPLAQPQQISMPRVGQMPDLPSPYAMRNWKQVAAQYDAFVFDQQKTGMHLPLVGIRSNGTNFPAIQPILLDTYVGTNSDGQAEAINIIPALVGASLVGIDKSNQSGVNWVEKIMDFYNSANGENVYLNSYNTFSGNDWWYDLMPNVFFYQLYTQYPSTQAFDEQFVSVADRWLEAVNAMGGNTTPWSVPQMNYRAWRLSTMTGNADGVKEPEAAGSIAWLLYHAGKVTGERKYTKGAMLAMDFLSAQTSNPSYELQLPYGVLAAAKMNAEHDTGYDLEKVINWCFDRGPLRGWGTINGTWDGNDVSGLIGEANDTGNDYAFLMNGFQQAAALVPVMKYDKRFARDIAKWTLNVANASRLFYSAYLPADAQDDYTWSNAHDPQSVIGYEALKENLDGKTTGTGDAKRSGWAATNLALYGSSHAGYLAAIVEPTDVDGIVMLDLNATDFFGENAFPSFAMYNPHASPHNVTIALGAETVNVYDAITETTILAGATGNVTVTAPAGEAMMLVYLPSGSTPDARDGKLFVDGKVVDHNYGYDFEPKFAIRSLDVADTLMEFGQQSVIYSTLQHVPGAVSYNWYVEDVLQPEQNGSTFTWTAPDTEGDYTIRLEVSSNSITVNENIFFRVVANIPRPPVITGITTEQPWQRVGEEIEVRCQATNEDGGPLTYQWTIGAGTTVSQNGSSMHWKLPGEQGIYKVTCKVTNGSALHAQEDHPVLVRIGSDAATPPFAYYPFDGDSQDHSGNGFHAERSGVQATDDARGEANKAWRFTSGDQIIAVASKPALNFTDQVTIAFWVKLDAVTDESFIVSHGSWEERYKVSVTPDRKLRWTVKSTSGTVDLDSSFPLALNQFYHFTVIFTGYSMELYADGVLDTFVTVTGDMRTTAKPLTFGRKDDSEIQYALKGTLDEVRLYNAALSPGEIETLKSLWNTTVGTGEEAAKISVYPNPSAGQIIVTGFLQHPGVYVTDLLGRPVDASVTQGRGDIHIRIHDKGVFIIRLVTNGKTVITKVCVR